MPKPKSDKNYFTQDTENAIVEYNNSTSYPEKEKIYHARIHYPFFKLTENIIHTFKFYYTEVENIEDLQHEVITFLLTKCTYTIKLKDLRRTLISELLLKDI